MFPVAMPTPVPRRDPPPVAADPALAAETASLRLVVRSVVACVLGERADHPDVEDCTHESLRRALEGQERLRGGEPLRPWVIGIARHVALDARRARGRAQRVEQLPEASEEERPRAERIADPAPGPDERLDQAERTRRVRAAMAQLADGPRRALTMFHQEDLDYQEIARRLGVPMGTVATWIARGRRALALALSEDEQGNEPEAPRAAPLKRQHDEDH
jgi:RNA polymerase sigma-70 factor (ECF subfamily)